MSNWEQASGAITGTTGRTEPRPRTITKDAPRNKTFSINISEPVSADLADIAEAKGLSRNALINEILEQYIDAYYTKRK